MILAIDPGSQKTGMALVREDGSLFRKAVVPTEELGAHILRAMDGNEVRAVVMGNGTRHKELKALAEEALKKGVGGREVYDGNGDTAVLGVQSAERLGPLSAKGLSYSTGAG